jgi:hypothetical protein
VLFDKRPILLAGLAACLLSLLTSCANSPTGKALERSFATDPKLKDSSTIFGDSSQTSAQNQTSAQLPEDFPREIPRYPEAKLEKVDSLTVSSAQGQLTNWLSLTLLMQSRDFTKRHLKRTTGSLSLSQLMKRAVLLSHVGMTCK